MKKQKLIAYGILLPAAALALLAAGLGVQESHARYVTVAGWHTQVYEPADAVTSSLLVEGGHTVLIGTVTPQDSYRLPVWFAAEGGNITGTLVCKPLKNGKYVTVDFPANLTMVQGTPQNFTLTIQPTELAQSIPAEGVDVELQMYLAEYPSLKATLQLELQPGTQEEEESTSKPTGVLRDLGSHVTIMENYAPGSLLGMTCDIPQGSTLWRLGLLDGNTQKMPFPAGTRYSLNGGESYWMLPKDAWIDLPLNEEAPVALWLDFSRVDTDKIVFGGILNITVSGEAEGRWHGEKIFSVNAKLELPGNSADTAVALVTQEKPLQLTIPSQWDNTRLEYTLTRQGQESEAPLPTVTVKEGKIIVSAEDGLPKPGAYVLTLTWLIDDLQVARREIVLFVNYSVYAEIVDIPQSTTPQETTPEETVPEETQSNETQPNETQPNETQPDETIPQQTVSQETVPNVTEGGETV